MSSAGVAIAMECPKCASTHTRKNGKQRDKQNYILVQCKHQFIESYEPQEYSEDVKRECLKIYVNGSIVLVQRQY
jgi:transposase-like protein